MDDLSGLGTHTEIFRIQPNFVSALPVSIVTRSKIMNYRGTVGTILAETEVSPVLLTFRYLNIDKTKEHDLLTFFETQEGSVKAFWSLSFTNDFTLLEPITNGEQSVVCSQNNFFDIIQYPQAGIRFFILKKNNDLITREITLCNDIDATRQELFVDSPFLENTSVDDVDLFGRLYLTRFYKDTLRLTYVTTKVSECSFELYEVYREV